MKCTSKNLDEKVSFSIWPTFIVFPKKNYFAPNMFREPLNSVEALKLLGHSFCILWFSYFWIFSTTSPPENTPDTMFVVLTNIPNRFQSATKNISSVFFVRYKTLWSRFYWQTVLLKNRMQLWQPYGKLSSQDVKFSQTNC